jgi:hypothetical protein
VAIFGGSIGIVKRLPSTVFRRPRRERVVRNMNKQKKLSPIERFIALSDAEKDAQVAPYEKGTDPRDWHPLTPAQRRQWSRIKRKVGRPRVGKGAKIVPVNIERGLLKEADSFAKQHKLKRSQMVAEGLRLVMKRAG